MIEADVAPVGPPSAFEAVLGDWLGERPLRYDCVIGRPGRAFLVDALGHGRRAGEESASLDDGVPASVAVFAGLLEEGGQRLAAARAAQLRQCREAAVLARELAAFAAARPAAVLDRPAAEVGAAAAASRAARPAALRAVSEWAVDEVMAALGLSSAAASRLLVESVTLVEQLPATLGALEAGTISWAHVRMLVEVLAPLTDDATRGEVEAGLIAGAAGRTVAQLRAGARRAVLRADAAAAARRLAEAVRNRSVRVFPGEDGMASLVAALPTPVALACRSALERYAQDCRGPGDERTRDQRMVDCLVDLVLRPGETGLPPVQAQLTVVAPVATLRGGNQPGADEPGEVDGHPVPAALVRELAHSLGLLPHPDTSDTPALGTRHTPPAKPAVDGRPAAETAETGETAETAETAAQIGELLAVRTVAGTALSELPAIAVVEEISGQLLALATGTGLRATARAGHGLGPPPDTPGYRPGRALQDFVRARDRRCRFPGCRAPAIRCDLDHNRPWPTGATSADNLCCLCRHHHRLSHQAPGWRMRRLPDGALEWTTPGGERITTRPPRYGTDDHPPPQPVVPPPRTPRELVLGRPPQPGDDPAPF
ncbi:MAG: DUF222 domain-containing protein [Actinomycetes bacterium]